MSQIHSTAVIDKTAEIADDVVIGPNSVVGANCSIGPGTALDACVVIGANVKVGKNNRLFSNCVIGKAPQVLGFDDETQFGSIEIGDNNIIRENVTIHPSMYPDGKTTIGSDNLLMIGVHIGHDAVIEDKTVISNYSQISGHCNIQTGVWLSGMVVMHQFVTISKWVYAAGFSGINHDVPPFMIICGHYPPEVRSVNKRGLSRAGLNEDQQDNIYAAFKKLYKQDGVLLEKAKFLVAQTEDDNVKCICDSIINSSKHRFGRYLESFRR